MSFDKAMNKIAKPVDFKGLAGILGAGKRTYRGGVNNPVSGPRTIPGGYASLLGPTLGETRGRPKKQKPDLNYMYPPSVITARLTGMKK